MSEKRWSERDEWAKRDEITPGEWFFRLADDGLGYELRAHTEPLPARSTIIGSTLRCADGRRIALCVNVLSDWTDEDLERIDYEGIALTEGTQ